MLVSHEIKGRTKTNLTKRPKKTAMTAWTMVITTVNFTWAALWPMMILASLSHRYQMTTGLALGKSRDGEGSAYFIGSEDTKTVENRPLLTTSIDSPDIPRHRWCEVQAVIMFVGKLNENQPNNDDNNKTAGIWKLTCDPSKISRELEIVSILYIWNIGSQKRPKIHLDSTSLASVM